MTSLSVRHMVVSCLHDRGANEDQMSLLLGEYRARDPCAAGRRVWVKHMQ